MVMMTETVSGKTRRCTGACHYARQEKCTCICGGKFHGGKGGEARQSLLMFPVKEEIRAANRARKQDNQVGRV